MCNLPGAELCRRHARYGAEGAGEGAVVIEAALVRDLGDGAVGFAEEARCGGDARFCNELDRGDVVDALDDAGESPAGSLAMRAVLFARVCRGCARGIARAGAALARRRPAPVHD